MNVAIIGCGLIGHKRARALGKCRLAVCSDTRRDSAQALGLTAPGAMVYSRLKDALARRDVNIVIVATTHNALAATTLAAINAGKHVLVEKPGALKSSELNKVIAAAKRKKVRVRVGFNHRYHRAFRKAREIVDSGALGPLMYVRARYGHGGRPGYEKEWRANPKLSGGGELIDQGVHLIDLARWFLGDFTHVSGFAHTYFWKMPVEDNGFLLLRTAKNQAAFLHASWTEWKNQFSFELFGRDGKLEVSGLGGSYGTERLAFYRMSPDMGPPETTTWEFPMADDSWEVEFAEFVKDIRLKREPSASLKDAQAALRIVERVYATNHKPRTTNHEPRTRNPQL